MIQNYLKITIRNLKKYKIYSFVNILGLTIGLTCSMVIMIYVFDEFSFDRFHEKADRIYRLGREVTSAEGEMREPFSSAPTANALLQDYPEIQNVVRFRDMGPAVVRYADNKFKQQWIYYTDASVFNIFTFPMIQGDPKTALGRPFSVVITRDMAEKYFGDEDPMGKVLKFNNQEDFIVTGVIDNIPHNSHLEIRMLCSFETLYEQQHPIVDDWLNFGLFTYVLLQEDSDYKALEQKFPALIDHYIAKDLKRAESTLRFYLHPLVKIHLYSHLEGYSPGLISQVYYFSMLALFIILIACINFMNLSTASSAKRAKEVGIRKTIGASKFNLVRQFLSETIVLSLISLVFALLLTQFILPFFSNLIDHKLTLNFIKMPGLVAGFAGLALFTGLISGSYPAFYLSRFQAVRVIQGKIILGNKKSRLRSVLVVVQFIISTMLIHNTIILDTQVDFLKHKDIGFNKKDVIVLPIVNDEIRESVKSLKQELRTIPQVIDVAATSTRPGLNVPRSVKIPENYSRTQVQLMDDMNVDHDFIPTLGIKMAAGRNFAETFTTDQQEAIIINETAARKFGWDSPLGKTIQYSIGQDEYATGTVVGVVKDFHLASLYRKIEPLFISNDPDNLNHLLVHVQSQNIPETVRAIRQKWDAMFANHPFEYSFLEDSYDTYFHIIQKVLRTFSIFTFLAILLACMGIFALATFTVERRTKEIGIRKVLGETTWGIVIRLNKDILRLVAIAAVIVMPLLFLQPNSMEQFFAYLGDFSNLTFFKAAGLIFLVAIATISYHSVKAALANPVKALRYE